MRRIFLAMTALGAVAMSGCAYVNVTPITKDNNATAKGVRIFSPKPYVIVNNQAVSTIFLPDCKHQYAVKFGTVLAKNELTLDLTNGMLSKLDSKQDTTVIGTNFLTAVTEAAKVGKSLGTAFSAKAEGGTSSLTVFEAGCTDGGELTLKPVNGLSGLDAVAPQTTAPADSGDAGTPPPKGM